MTNTIALVTGAAGGIGAAVVRALAEQGTTVAALDRDEEGLRAMADALAADGLRAEPYPVDVSDHRAVEQTVDRVERELGPVDQLVNAAGILRLGEVRDFSVEDWTATFAVNVNGVFHVSRAVIDRMIPRRRGAVVTVASNAASTPRTEMAAYAASKAAATMFTKSLGLEVAKYGIRCNLVAPGSTDTPMLSSMWHDETGPRNTLRGRPDAFRVGIPLNKLARPADIAAAVLFLLSDAAGHITLHDLTVDGGASLGA
ncbi:2,3-dihydro-2,3-dihydroxybenzoate dehydrogenase [Streptomyces rubellomurinus]|uniref:2,3-dihydro-2,3-dihydroxybenzoate dehydrogenase n=2 Tax=Streptomyces TaxID=1883 RepID=A0A0F2TIL7_STRR3|nr:2,3-dihydro-2,3-dihydroxybenzoate dehydrogenase [Streptomyces rubellomurinus]KJS53042.1 2,3-dihydroxybenzoate-2,3-dehydrogenase [Streptomyces rubellomurinus subsp. indigoferus]KJS62120.1 2,3-dihydroxybenzoate-2,3-dehydrogenase [Streptomyces rubellomurinus]